MSASRPVMHVLSHTHWDREWYQPFQGYRKRLVMIIDSLLDLLEADPRFRCFHLDAQTALLEDYLQIRPSQRQRLAGHIESGRIRIGPWFVMPDELLASGEALVRNLLLGCRECRQWRTQPMPIGYVTDVFGHVSQLPQILAGFGIDSVMLHRGTPGTDETTEMLWVGADGTESLIVKVFIDTGYCDFWEHRQTSDEQLRTYEARKLELATTDVLFSLDGNDHQPARVRTPERIEEVNRVFQQVQAKHSSMTQYLSQLKQALGADWKSRVRRFEGELRWPIQQGQWAEVFHGTASARAWIKQANDRVEWLLSRVAEPLGVWARAAGADDQKPFLDLAWRYLLLNHPHDTIVGCSLDQVARDAGYRFDQAELLAQDAIWESMQHIVEQADTASLGQAATVLTAMNPAATRTDRVIEADLFLEDELARDLPKQAPPVLINAAGQAVYTELLETEESATPWPLVHKVREGQPDYKRDRTWSPHRRYRLRIADSIGPMGWASWAVRFDVEPPRQLPAGLEPVRFDTDRRTLDNGLIWVRLADDGRLDLTDHATGRTFHGLLDLEDCGDVGNGWDHKYPHRDRRVLAGEQARKSPVRIQADLQQGLAVRLTLRRDFRVPAAATASGKGRLKRTVNLPVLMELTLRAGARRLECRMQIDNTARDHRLRAILPTGLDCDHWFSDSAFDVVRRNVALIDTTGWKEQAREECVIKNFAAICDGTAGLAVLTRGLNEAAVQDLPGRPIALTLFRAYSQPIAGQITEDSQQAGVNLAEFALLPLACPDGQLPVGEIFAELDRYKLGLQTWTAQPHQGSLPAETSTVAVSGNLVVSTQKAAEDGRGQIVRVWNPAEMAIEGWIRPTRRAEEAWLTALSEEDIRPVEIGPDGRIELSLPPKSVASLRLL